MSPKKEYSFIFAIGNGVVSSGETEKSLLGRMGGDRWPNAFRDVLRSFMDDARPGDMLDVTDTDGYTNIIVCNYAGESTP